MHIHSFGLDYGMYELMWQPGVRVMLRPVLTAQVGHDDPVGLPGPFEERHPHHGQTAGICLDALSFLALLAL